MIFQCLIALTWDATRSRNFGPQNSSGHWRAQADGLFPNVPLFNHPRITITWPGDRSRSSVDSQVPSSKGKEKMSSGEAYIRYSHKYATSSDRSTNTTSCSEYLREYPAEPANGSMMVSCLGAG